MSGLCSGRVPCPPCYIFIILNIHSIPRKPIWSPVCVLQVPGRQLHCSRRRFRRTGRTEGAACWKPEASPGRKASVWPQDSPFSGSKAIRKFGQNAMGHKSGRARSECGRSRPADLPIGNLRVVFLCNLSYDSTIGQGGVPTSLTRRTKGGMWAVLWTEVLIQAHNVGAADYHDSCF